VRDIWDKRTEQGVSTELITSQLTPQQGYTPCGFSQGAFLCGTNLSPPSSLTKSLTDFNSEQNKSYLTWVLFLPLCRIYSSCLSDQHHHRLQARGGESAFLFFIAASLPDIWLMMGREWLLHSHPQLVLL